MSSAIDALIIAMILALIGNLHLMLGHRASGLALYFSGVCWAALAALRALA